MSSWCLDFKAERNDPTSISGCEETGVWEGEMTYLRSYKELVAKLPVDDALSTNGCYSRTKTAIPIPRHQSNSRFKKRIEGIVIPSSYSGSSFLMPNLFISEGTLAFHCRLLGALSSAWTPQWPSDLAAVLLLFRL